MRSAIYDLLYNKIGNIDNIKLSEEWEKVRDEFNECYDKLEATLNAEQKKLLNELYFLSGGVTSEVEVVFFEEGFKTATRLLAECLK